MIKNDHTFLSGGLTSPLVEFDIDCSHQCGNYHHPTNTPPIQPFHVDYPSLTISSTTTAAVEVASHRTSGGGDSSGGGDNRQTQMNALLLKSLLSTLDTLDRSPAAISPQNLVMSTKMA